MVIATAWAAVIKTAAVRVATLWCWTTLKIAATVTAKITTVATKAAAITTTVVAKIAITTTGIKTAASRLAASVAATTTKITTWGTAVITPTKGAAWAVRRWCKALLWLKPGNHAGFEVLLRVMLNVLNLAAVTKLSDRDGIAFAASTAGTANAVNVVFSLHRQAVVDNVGDGWHVQTASCNISSHQHLHTAITESHQTAVAQALTQRAVQRHGAKAVLHQIIGQAVALHLRAGKHDRLIDRGVA